MGSVGSNCDTIYRDICKFQMHSLGIFDHTGRSEAHRYCRPGVVLPTPFYVYSRWVVLQGLRNSVVVGSGRELRGCYKGLYVKFTCAALEFLSISSIEKPMGS